MKDAVQSHRGRPFRPEIQGLRALAVLLVMIYHVGTDRISGGVDVFFVISGYLIVGGLLRQLDRTGRIDVVAYLSGLVRRLIPAAMVVLAVTLVCTAWLLPQVRWPAIIQEILASALYFQNWQLARTAVDYLAQDQAASPVQHFWALSVQGQFYLLALLLVVVAGPVARWYRREHTRVALVLVLAVLAASLLHGALITLANQPLAYFDTLARFWQFLLGGLVAALPAVAARSGTLVRDAAGWLAVAAIILCGVFIGSGQAFPVPGALWPSLAAVVVLTCTDARARYGAGRVLALPPLQWLGGISYSLYLWHWPVLVMTLSVIERESLRSGQASLVVAISVLLAWLTTRLVEDPVRHGTRRPAARTRACVLGGLLPVVAVTLTWQFQIEQRIRQHELLMIDDIGYPGAMVMHPGFNAGTLPELPPVPGPLEARRDLPAVYQDGCHQGLRHPEVLSCSYGEAHARITLAVVGGSHSAHWLPAVKRVAARHDWRILTFTKSACRFSAWRPGGNPSCQEWNDRLLNTLAASRPDLVLTTATMGTAVEEHVPAAYLAQWRRLEALDIPVLAIRDTPRPGFDVPECVERHGADHPQCKVPRSTFFTRDPLAAVDDLPSNTHFLDATDYFCDIEHCHPVLGNVLVYRDDHHLTARFAASLAPVVETALLEALRPSAATPDDMAAMQSGDGVHCVPGLDGCD